MVYGHISALLPIGVYKGFSIYYLVFNYIKLFKYLHLQFRFFFTIRAEMF